MTAWLSVKSVLTYDVVAVLSEASQLGRTAGRHVQYVPDVLVGSLEAAEPDGDSEQSLAAPHVTGDHLQLAGSKQDSVWMECRRKLSPKLQVGRVAGGEHVGGGCYYRG